MLNRTAKFVVAVLVLSLSVPLAASAAPKEGTINVTPGQLNFTLAKQDTEQTATLHLTNSYDAPITLVAQFKGIDENAGLLVPVDRLDPTFAASLNLSQTDLTIDAHSEQNLTVQANNLPSLSPGGHYASLVLTQLVNDNQRSSLRASLSLSIFVIKTEGERVSLDLPKITTNALIFRLPTVTSLNFVNTGNVHVVPRAVVNLLGSNGETILSQGVANAASLPLLPDNSLISTVAMSQTHHAWLPQRVQLQVVYRANGVNDPRIITRKLWYIPPFYIILAVGLAYIAFRKRHRVLRVVTPTLTVKAKKPPLIIRPTTFTRIIPVKDGPEDTSKLSIAKMPRLKSVPKSKSRRKLKKRPKITKKNKASNTEAKA
ncbi:MAG: hypothetical protein ABI220_04430 [Candidatus Saccharimonadales bacterium]